MSSTHSDVEISFAVQLAFNSIQSSGPLLCAFLRLVSSLHKYADPRMDLKKFLKQQHPGQIQLSVHHNKTMNTVNNLNKVTHQVKTLMIDRIIMIKSIYARFKINGGAGLQSFPFIELRRPKDG